jgi:BirA family biotin operon repressor/biotin-[acetyl-CoA-carboxylase] ligase
MANDIYVDKNKISGILIENSVTGIRMNYSIIGIGLNINQKNFLSDAPNPISLCEILKKNLTEMKFLEC